MDQKSVSPLKSHLGQLESHLNEKKPLLENAPNPLEKETLVRQEIKKFIQNVQENVSPTLQTSAPSLSQVQALEPNQKVGHLINLTLEKGLDHSIAIAKQLDDPALVDEFHDILVDNFYNELVKRGVIEVV